ncbi:MAG: homoserine kinase [Coriobacteriia bacterium]|nr:homoserine kinase [Coriobacteriia bacterium]
MTGPSAVSVRVPATVANVGPGFDTFALALGVHDTYVAEPAQEWSISVSGVDAGAVPSGDENLVIQAMKAVCGRLGVPLRAHVTAKRGIPLGRGLGSSAAAIIGGVVLAWRLAGAEMRHEDILDAAVRIEGHADNVAAALLGGFVVAYEEDSVWRAERFDPACGMACVLAVPHEQAGTGEMRGVLPEAVRRSDAVYNISHGALLVAGIVSGSSRLLSMGARDRLHQAERFERIRDAREVIALVHSVCEEPVVLSGSGPTLAVLVCGSDDASALEHAQDLASRLEQLSTIPGRSFWAVALERRGALGLG